MRKQLNHGKAFAIIICFIQVLACAQPAVKQTDVIGEETPTMKELILGNAQTSAYFFLLRGKRIGFVGNHTSVINGRHLVDSLLAADLNVVKVFSPEHGFRGNADAGEKVASELDPTTGLPIISLYGSNKKPSATSLKGVEVLLFDMQDVGVRFYTYISTLHYVMEAAAENNIPLIVLDRPNPNGHYVDGPVLEKEFQSFVGMHPVAAVHGMTIGEYAQMINGEKWLKNEVQCELTVIPCKNYDHKKRYDLSIPPSPNLPNMRSIYLYPSLCFFEGTPISIGRGTAFPFQQIGHPSLEGYAYSFTPEPTAGAKSPKLKGQVCYGINLTETNIDSLRAVGNLQLDWLLKVYEDYQGEAPFFTSFFNLLAGTDQLKEAIESGKTAQEIKETWEPALSNFKAVRKKYLLYTD
jgi:uncharacterized protein YbbC (DUF1343 family)